MKKHNNSLFQTSGLLEDQEGTLILSGTALKIFNEWSISIEQALGGYDEQYFTSGVLHEDILSTASYLDHFPHQLYMIKSDVPQKSSWYLSPAVCFYVYERLKKTRLTSNAYCVFVSGRCARVENETHEFPFRMKVFTMIEVVLLGTKEQVDYRREELRYKTEKMLSNKKLIYNKEAATDAFFLGESEGAQIMQKLKNLKQEYRVYSGEKSYAVASVNNHEDYFGKRFSIHTKDGTPCYTSCIAFGLERLTAASILAQK